MGVTLGCVRTHVKHPEVAESRNLGLTPSDKPSPFTEWHGIMACHTMQSPLFHAYFEILTEPLYQKVRAKCQFIPLITQLIYLRRNAKSTMAFRPLYLESVQSVYISKWLVTTSPW